MVEQASGPTEHLELRSLHVAFDEGRAAGDVEIVETAHSACNLLFLTVSVPPVLEAGHRVIDRDEQRGVVIPIRERDVVQGHVAGDSGGLAQVRQQPGIRLEGHDATTRPDEAGEQRQMKTDIRPDVEHEIAVPDGAAHDQLFAAFARRLGPGIALEPAE